MGPYDGLPELQQNVKVVGYPFGGDQISITSGVVSRIDSSPYCGVDTFLMAIQIDAAINPGNSGGPALSNNIVVGNSFLGLDYPTIFDPNWLDDLTLYQALRESHGGWGWTTWPEPERDRHPAALSELRQYIGVVKDPEGPPMRCCNEFVFALLNGKIRNLSYWQIKLHGLPLRSTVEGNIDACFRSRVK